MKQIIKLVNFLNLISAIYLTASLIYNFSVQRFGYTLFFTSFLLETILEKKWQNIKIEKKKIHFLIMIFFFTLALIYIPFEETRKYSLHYLENRLAILGFGFVGIFGVNNKFKLSYFLNIFIVSSVVAISYIIYRIGLGELIANNQRIELFNLGRVDYVNNHMSFNMFLNISIVSGWYILSKSWTKISWWFRLLYSGALLLIIGTLSISEGRTGFVTAIFLVSFFILYEMWKRNKIWSVFLGVLVCIFVVGVISKHKRISENQLKYEPRIFLWKTAITVIKNKPILGYGASTAQVNFDSIRIKNQDDLFKEYSSKIPWEQHCHNQFLQTTMEFGLFGLFVLLSLFMLPVIFSDYDRKILSIVILFPSLYQSVFDIAITGMGFAATFGILSIMILSIQNNVVLPHSEIKT